jgi:hypothetical protein
MVGNSASKPLTILPKLSKFLIAIFLTIPRRIGGGLLSRGRGGGVVGTTVGFADLVGVENILILILYI